MVFPSLFACHSIQWQIKHLDRQYIKCILVRRKTWNCVSEISCAQHSAQCQIWCKKPMATYCTSRIQLISRVLQQWFQQHCYMLVKYRTMVTTHSLLHIADRNYAAKYSSIIFFKSFKEPVSLPLKLISFEQSTVALTLYMPN